METDNTPNRSLIKSPGSAEEGRPSTQVIVGFPEEADPNEDAKQEEAKHSGDDAAPSEALPG